MGEVRPRTLPTIDKDTVLYHHSIMYVVRVWSRPSPEVVGINTKSEIGGNGSQGAGGIGTR